MMARTTLDIDTPVLEELKRLSKVERTSLGRLVSDLLSESLGRRRRPSAAPELAWQEQDMGALIDIADKDALHATLDRKHP